MNKNTSLLIDVQVHYSAVLTFLECFDLFGRERCSIALQFAFEAKAGGRVAVGAVVLRRAVVGARVDRVQIWH